MKTTLLAIMAMQYLNTPYRWGGNCYDGLDCSGLVLKALNDVGKTLPDMTSQGLYDYFYKQNKQSLSCIENDCILFFGKDIQSITHVSIAINEKYMIEAGGAGKNSLVMGLDELAKRDARVRIKPIKLRSDLVAFFKVRYEDEQAVD